MLKLRGEKERMGTGRCLTYVPLPHDGTGWVQTCVSLLENFPADVLLPTFVTPKTWKAVSPSVEVKESLSFPLSLIPYRYLAQIAQPTLDYRFRHCIAAANPRQTLAYFWPTPPLSLVRHAREHGFLVVREMINTCMGTAKGILDEAYEMLGLPHSHGITNEMIESEREELSSYDYIFAPSPLVEQSLVDIGIQPFSILRSTFGWAPSRYAFSVGEEGRTGFRALFVGSICVRKGVPQLLAAWKRSGVDGELLLAGKIETALKPLLEPYVKRHNVRVLDFVSDVGRLYKSADIFVFPTLEEGAPQVTYEAAGCGLPIITTPMGSARIIEHEINGFVVKPYDLEGLAEAITRLANAPALRRQMSQKAAKDAMKYTYEKVGLERARILIDLLANR